MIIKATFVKRHMVQKAEMAQAALRKKTKVAMQKVVDEMYDDVLNKVPMPPYETGWLREHHIGFVSGTFHHPVGVVKTYDTPYATRQHVGLTEDGRPFDYKTPGTGAGWMLIKRVRYRRKYTKIFAQEIRRILREATKA